MAYRYDFSPHINSDVSSDVMLTPFSDNILFEQPAVDDLNEISLCDGLARKNPKNKIASKKDGYFLCDKCNHKIRRKDNFKRHMLKVHKIKYQDEMVAKNYKNICIYPDCEEVFYHKSKMVKHLEDFHGLQVDIEYLNFLNFMKFIEWKEAEESSNFVCFTKRDERRELNSVIYSSYVCHSDGRQSNKDLKKYVIPRKGVKQDLICPARMLVHQNMLTGNIFVKYIKSHSHPISYKDQIHHPIPKSVKDQIVKKLMTNKSVGDVFSELRQEALQDVVKPNNTVLRKIHIDKAKIEYIQQKLNIPKRLKNTTPGVDRLKSLATVTFNPVLLCDPDSLFFHCEGKNRKLDNFFFGMQTEEQSITFQKYASNVVFLDLTYPIPSVPYYILSLKVLDDNSLWYNVAHLISNVPDEDMVERFLSAIKLRCTGNVPTINTIMITMDVYGLKAVDKIFDKDIRVLYSKLHFHQVMFNKLVLDYPFELELCNQVYFTLVALIEETDLMQFELIANEFVNLYKDLCPMFVKFLSENYLIQAEMWASCYREPQLLKSDSLMHHNTTSQCLKDSRKGVKVVCDIDELIHLLLNIDQETYLKQKQLNQIVIDDATSHEIGLAIPNEDVSKIVDGHWLVACDNLTYEVNLIAELCPEKFCLTRCLDLSCFGLCHHLYSCSCHVGSSLICSHIHKVHSMETGIPYFLSMPNATDSQGSHPTFKLYEQMSSRIRRH